MPVHMVCVCMHTKIAECLSVRLLVLEGVFSVGGVYPQLPSYFRNAIKGVAYAQTSILFRNAIKRSCLQKVAYTYASLFFPSQQQR